MAKYSGQFQRLHQIFNPLYRISGRDVLSSSLSLFTFFPHFISNVLSLSLSIAQLIKASDYAYTGRYPVQARVVFLDELSISLYLWLLYSIYLFLFPVICLCLIIVSYFLFLHISVTSSVIISLF